MISENPIKISPLITLMTSGIINNNKENSYFLSLPPATIKLNIVPNTIIIIRQTLIALATALSDNIILDGDYLNFVPQEIHLYKIFSSSDNILPQFGHLFI